MNVNGITEILNKFVRNYLRHVHTIKPAIVTSIDHASNRLDAKILTNTRMGSGVNIPLPDVRNVPYFILSANRGNAKVTMPIAVGDNVIILFSDRDTQGLTLNTDGKSVVDAKDIKTHEYDPILALPSFYTTQSSTEVDSSNIVVSNGSTNLKIAPDGSIDMNSSTAVNVTAPTSTFNGNVVVNGDINATGTITGDTDVVAGTISGNTHTHPGDSGGTTGSPQ